MATPLSSQCQIEAQTVLGTTKCGSCGKTVQIKVMKNGTCFYTCWNSNQDTGEPCTHHVRWGAKNSRDMRANFLAKEQKAKMKPANLDRPPAQAKPAQGKRPDAAQAKPDQPKAANTNTAPEPARKSGGLMDEYGF